MNKTEKGSSGVCRIIDDELCAYPFGNEYSTVGMSKSGANYNHQRLWEEVRPAGCRHGFHFYPRGQLEVREKGNAIVYMNPNIGAEWVPEIKAAFSLAENPSARYDGSKHYQCYLDEGSCESRNK